VKFAFILLLIVLIIILGFNISTLRKELRSAMEYSKFIEESNEELHRKLIRLSEVNSEKEKLLNEVDQIIEEFDRKVPFATMEKNIPKRIWNDIKPIINRIQVFQEARGKGLLQSDSQ